MDGHFELLGLPRRFDVDAGKLEANYLARSRESHPDFQTGQGSLEQHARLQLSSRLNDAYTTLKDPFKRAEYMLGLLGGPAASEKKDMPKEFLAETLEFRMLLEELKEAEDAAGLATFENEMRERRQRILDEVREEFEREPRDLPGIRIKLNALKFVQGLLRDL